MAVAASPALSPVAPAPPPAKGAKAAVATPENASALKHPDGPFTRFSAPIQAITLPTRGDYLRQNFYRNVLPSYERGFVHYFQSIKDHPAFGIGVGALTMGLGGLFTAFRRHHRVIESAFLVGALAYPLTALAQHLPQMMRAYDTLTEERDRAKADEQFKTALDKLVFKIGHVYLKPLGITALLTYPMMNFRRVPLALARRLTAKGLAFTGAAASRASWRSRFQALDAQLKRLDAHQWVSAQDRWANRLAAWGDQVVGRLAN